KKSTNTPNRLHATEVVNRDRSSEGQSYQRHLRDGGHGVSGSITGCKDHQRRDRASLMRAMSESGRVSRAPHELSAARNCTRDEGGPFEFGDEEPISGHLKLLWPIAVVVSVAVTTGP